MWVNLLHCTSTHACMGGARAETHVCFDRVSFHCQLQQQRPGMCYETCCQAPRNGNPMLAGCWPECSCGCSESAAFLLISTKQPSLTSFPPTRYPGAFQQHGRKWNVNKHATITHRISQDQSCMLTLLTFNHQSPALGR